MRRCCLPVCMLIMILLLLPLTNGCEPWPLPAATSEPTPNVPANGLPVDVDATDATFATVIRVVDGDTVIVDIDGEDYRVRYVGIDTPELASVDRPAEHYAAEATSFNQSLVEGKTVVLEIDTSDTDQYGRLLRYVWVDGELVNEALVRQGLAEAKHYPPDTSRQDTLDDAEDAARREDLGIWSAN